MKKLFLLLTLLHCTSMAWAYDVEVDGIYYNLNQTNKTAAVTFKGSSFESHDNDYPGEVVIPENFIYDGITYSVTSLGNNCFLGCTGLTSITIPNSVTSLGDDCFQYCTGLTNIKMKSSTPPSAGSEVFEYCTNLTTVYVPKGAKEAYNVEPWNSYEIVEMENTSIAAAPTVDSQKASAPVYDLNGRRIGTADAMDALPKGVYIVNGKKAMK